MGILWWSGSSGTCSTRESESCTQIFLRDMLDLFGSAYLSADQLDRRRDPLNK